jgi:hypothetical protein
MKKSSIALGLCFALIFSHKLHAQTNDYVVQASQAPNSSFELNYYVTATADYTKIKISEQSFNPTMSQIKFGTMVKRGGLFKGLGLELVMGQAIDDDQNDGFELAIDQHWGAYATFATFDQKNFKFAINLGYSATELSTYSDSIDNTIAHTIEGFSYGFTYQQNFSQTSNFSWNLDCNRLYQDDNAEIASCGLGVSYEF